MILQVSARVVSYRKNTTTLASIVDAVSLLETQHREATFNAILSELSSSGILSFHRTLRKYLDLLVLSKVLTVKFEKNVQPNIRKKQIYRLANDRPLIEAGEKALVFHGLNWDVPSPLSLIAKIDLQALSVATISEGKVYSSLEDAIAYSLAILPKKHPRRYSELIVFVTAMLAPAKINFNYLLTRSKQLGVENEIANILLSIDKTLSSANPNVEDIRTLFKLRVTYEKTRESLLKALNGIPTKSGLSEIVSSNEVIEYAGKQLGLRG